MRVRTVVITPLAPGRFPGWRTGRAWVRRRLCLEWDLFLPGGLLFHVVAGTVDTRIIVRLCLLSCRLFVMWRTRRPLKVRECGVIVDPRCCAAWREPI